MHFTPFSRPKSQRAFLCQQLLIHLSYCNRIRLRKKTQSKTIVHKKTVRIHKLKILPFFPNISSRWKNNVSPLKKTTTLFNPCQSFSTARFDDYFFQSKSFMRRRVRRYRLRHKIHAIKTRPNNPLRFLQHKNSYPSLFGKRFNLRRSQNDVQNTKAFSQQTIHAQIKRSTVWIRPHSFDTGFNNSNVAMHRQTFFSSFS